MVDRIIIADPSRTVRTLVKLTFRDSGQDVTEVAERGGLAGALGEGPEALLIVDEDWIEEGARGASAVVILGASTHRGMAWSEVLGLDPARVTSTPKPVSRQAVREASGRVAVGAPRASAGDVQALVAAEVSRVVEEEIRSVVWRIVPELAERLIKEELQRLLKEDEEDES